VAIQFRCSIIILLSVATLFHVRHPFTAPFMGRNDKLLQAVRQSSEKLARELLQAAKLLLKRFDQLNPFKPAKRRTQPQWKAAQSYERLSTQAAVRAELQKVLADLGALRMTSSDEVRDLKHDIRKALSR
jgi:hypothetical protein